MLEFKCKCGQKIKVDNMHAGKSGRCPKCKQIIDIKRLRALPWASSCIKCQHESER